MVIFTCPPGSRKSDVGDGAHPCCRLVASPFACSVVDFHGSMVSHRFPSLDLKELSGSCRAGEMEIVIRFEQVACWHLANSARPAEGKEDKAESIPKT